MTSKTEPDLNVLRKPDWGVVEGRLLAFIGKSVGAAHPWDCARTLGEATVSSDGILNLTISAEGLRLVGDALADALADMAADATSANRATPRE